MSIELKKVWLVNMIAVATLSNIGCASGSLRAVTEGNKDSSGSYDGRWVAEIVNTPAVQQSIGGVAFMRCSDNSGKSLGNINVSDGQLNYRYRGQPIVSYVNSSGGFKLDIPVDSGGFSGGSDTFTAKKDNVTIAGSLKNGKGYFKITSTDFGGAGCTSSVSYSKI